MPQAATAFWPFSTSKAADITNDSAILTDSHLALLDPAINSDPNPTKGGLDVPVSAGMALVANAGPAGTLPASVSGTASDAISLYQVREGDSLSEIADMFGVTTNTILWANNIKDAKTIHPGDTLLILPVSGVKHTVTKGETLAGVAKKYSADADEVALFNGLDSSAALAVGSTIIIPGGEVDAPIAKSSTSSKSTTAKSSAVGKTLVAISGYFGNPLPGGILTQGLHGHNAVDIGAPSGTPIYAAAEGTVIVSKNDGAWNGGYGSYVVITHPNGTQTLYAHMSSDISTVGESVTKGQLIGYVGRTGEATGNHLHFEVRGAANPFAK